jgi:hypothetical protein
MTSPRETRERRLRRRHGLDDVHGNVLFSYECRILDLSERGMAVRTTAALAPGRSYALKIQNEDRQISLSGTVAWCRLQGTEKNERGESVAVYTAGIELAGQLSERSSEILPLLEARGVARLERRLNGRLVPRGAGAAGPDEPAAAAIVREVSRAGMIVEAPFLARQGDLLDLDLELGEEVMTATVRVVRGRSLGMRDGRGWTELAVEYAEMTAAAKARLDRLVREELGLAPSPSAPSP